MPRRTVNLVADLTAVRDGRYFVMDWTHTRATVIRHWNYLRQNWRQGIDRPADRDYGVGAEPTFLCVCERILPVYLAQVDHILSQNDIPGKVTLRRILPPASPGPIRQVLFVDTDEDDVVTRIDARYLVEYQINPGGVTVYGLDVDIGRYAVEPGTGIVRVRIWDEIRHRETTEVFEFDIPLFGGLNIYTTLTHAGDDDFDTTVHKILINDLHNLQLLCGPCNTSKQERSFHYYQNYTSTILRGI